MPRITRAEDLFWPTPGHPVETIANLDAIPIQECGEALVVLTIADHGLMLQPMTGPFTAPDLSRKLWVRQSVAQRLVEAQRRLTEQRPAVRLVIVDAWRSPERQVRMHKVARLFFRLRFPGLPAHLIREAANKYVAAPDAVAPPPHSTGGAIDLKIWDESARKFLVMGAPSRTEHEKLTPAQRENRQLLSAAMNAAGFSNYEEEWWHWSYGDSGWALRTNRETALYGRTKPPDT